MCLSIISFTEKGMQLSKKIYKQMKSKEVRLFTKWSAVQETSLMSLVQFVEMSIGEWVKSQMEEKRTLLFIGACGIAVRAIAPYIVDKLLDSPVLVMDEQGNYIIPILSGHMGGANQIALTLASQIGALPIITTATDIHKKFAVDLFAKRNHLEILNKEGIAKVSAKVLTNKEITIAIEPEHLTKNVKLPKGIQIVSYPPMQPVDIIITTEETNDEALIYLRPKEYVIGIGCKKGKEINKIEAFIDKSIKEVGITKRQLFALASIDRKKDEEGLLRWSRKERIPFLTFSAEQLQEVEGNFSSSHFVKEQVGVDNVCERAALRACVNGKLIYKKHIEDGITIAIAKREWSVSFDEE